MFFPINPQNIKLIFPDVSIILFNLIAFVKRRSIFGVGKIIDDLKKLLTKINLNFY